MDMLSEFIMSERFHYDDDDQNKFAIFCWPALRYYGFLLIILDKYEKASKKMVEVLEKERKLMPKGDGRPVRVTMKQARLMEKSSGLMRLVHLEIESFYLFAKIFLDNVDNVARFLYVYFGQIHLKGAGLQSHDNLAQYHEKYFKAKGIVIPENLSESIILLKERICDYRDKEISHEHSLRAIKATSWSLSSGAIIAGGTINPRQGDKRASTEELPTLMDSINIYIRQVITLIETNREKSKLKLRDRNN
ncbi:hypothetical protein ACFLWI_00335 [Chloroflexota bacterium]